MSALRQNPRRILLAVTGLTPQIVTETLYALTRHPQAPWIPDEVHLITTATGAENARFSLLRAPQRWFHRLREDYALPPIDFPERNIHVLSHADGTELQDIRSPQENTLAADFITETVRRLTEDLDTELHVSIAGGRKTMGYYLGYALSLYGRPQDRLSHVLVSDPYETHREFYYPTPYDHPIQQLRGGKEITHNARKAHIELADIPFVRLRDGLPLELLQGEARFSQAVAAAQTAGRAEALHIDIPNRAVAVGGEAVTLSPKEFILLLWLAQRRLKRLGPVQFPVKASNPEAACEYLAICQQVFGPSGAETVRAKAGLKNGMDSSWFSPAKTRLHAALTRARGKTGAAPYLIHDSGPKLGKRFELAIAPERIHIQAGGST